MIPISPPRQLLDYTDALLAQMDAVVAGHCARTDGSFSDFVGPHVRHILEHYEALSAQIEQAGNSADAPVVDYDARARDQRVQTDPEYARKRITRLRASLQTLADWPETAFVSAVRLRVQGGVQGEFYVELPSNWLRELMFLASHCVHHFAVVKLQAQQRGTDLGEHFGKAPTTISHQSRPHAHAAIQ